MSRKRRKPSAKAGAAPKGPLTVIAGLPGQQAAESPGGLRGLMGQFFSRLWRYLATGMMIWVPLLVTLWLTWNVVLKAGFGIEGFIENLFVAVSSLGHRYPRLGFLTYVSSMYMPGFGFMFVIAVFLATGLVARYVVARRIIRFGEALVEHIPLISTIYRAVEQIRDVFVSRNGTVFERVCLIEYPRPGTLVVAFVTNRAEGIVQHAAGRPLTAVFVPTTPNPTSGFLLYVPPDEVMDVPISVEDAMKLIVSGGAYQPDPIE